MGDSSVGDVGDGEGEDVGEIVSGLVSVGDSSVGDAKKNLTETYLRPNL